VSVTAEQEIREQFAEWFEDAAARDIDALMARIADDAHSFEHQAPLEYRGADAIRSNRSTPGRAERASSRRSTAVGR
jgi:ketosteroid isomerase-like protein